MEDALTPHVELASGHWGYRVVDTGRIRPQLNDLNVARVDEIEPALHAWRSAALRYWSVDGWLEVESIAPLLGRLDAIRGALHHCRRTLDVADVWKLMQAPIDEDAGAWIMAADLGDQGGDQLGAGAMAGVGRIADRVVDAGLAGQRVRGLGHRTQRQHAATVGPPVGGGAATRSAAVPPSTG